MNKREKEKIVRNIKAIMDDKGYTRPSLSREADIPYASVTNILAHGTMPGVDIVLKMCRAMKVSPTMLLTGMDDETFLENCSDK